MEGCIFCEPPTTEIICENDLALASYDKFPVSKGHVLVIPKRHVPDYFGATTEEAAAFHELIHEVKKHLDQKYNPDGYNIGVNVGIAGGQTIFHLHMHVIPRYKGDVENPKGGVRNLMPNLVRY